MTQPTALHIIYPIRRIMPAAIIRGMSATACVKNSFIEFRAGATTAELFPCTVASAMLKFRTSSISNISGCTSMLIWVMFPPNPKSSC